jgi:hypothetical protein
MKWLASRSTWWHMLPHKSEHADNAPQRGAMDHIGVNLVPLSLFPSCEDMKLKP